jgi:IS1 family transposase
MDKIISIVKLVVEGMGIRGMGRYLGMEPSRIRAVLLAVGLGCVILHDIYLRRLETQDVQVDELWSFIGAKDKTLRQIGENPRKGHRGSVWTILAVDPDSMLIVSFLTGRRSYLFVEHFIRDLHARLAGRVRLVSDGYNAYPRAIIRVFGKDGVDYGMLQKSRANKKYVGATKLVILGHLHTRLITTTSIEVTNLHHRMRTRRTQRKTTGHSKLPLAHFAALALWAGYHNFCHRPRRLEGATPAVAANVVDVPWSIERLITTAISLLASGSQNRRGKGQ